MHIAPIGAEQESPLGFAERGEIAHHAVASAVENLPGIRIELAGQKLQQGGLAGPGFADNRQDLAGVQRERYVAAAELPAVPFGQSRCRQQWLLAECLTHPGT